MATDDLEKRLSAIGADHVPVKDVEPEFYGNRADRRAQQSNKSRPRRTLLRQPRFKMNGGFCS